MYPAGARLYSPYYAAPAYPLGWSNWGGNTTPSGYPQGLVADRFSLETCFRN